MAGTYYIYVCVCADLIELCVLLLCEIYELRMVSNARMGNGIYERIYRLSLKKRKSKTKMKQQREREREWMRVAILWAMIANWKAMNEQHGNASSESSKHFILLVSYKFIWLVHLSRMVGRESIPDRKCNSHKMHSMKLKMNNNNTKNHRIETGVHVWPLFGRRASLLACWLSVCVSVRLFQAMHSQMNQMHRNRKKSSGFNWIERNSFSCIIIRASAKNHNY